jgi:hypothetical protein
VKTMSGTLKAILGMALLAAVFAPTASAQCVNVNKFKHSALMLLQPFSSGQFSRAAFTSVAYSAQEDSQGASQDPIVGMWKVTFTSDGSTADDPPAGVVIDSGFQQWHSDGTEIHNSGTRPPASGDFCLGVWRNTGHSQYKLNHFATSWTPDGGSFLGLANIHETITLSHDYNSFAGTFTIDQYNTGGNLLAHVAGNIEGKRITLDTTVNDVL